MSRMCVQGGFQDSQFWDTQQPYHYVRLAKGVSHDGGDVIIVGGVQHPTGMEPKEHTEDYYTKLETWARRRWPQAQERVWAWSGQVC